MAGIFRVLTRRRSLARPTSGGVRNMASLQEDAHGIFQCAVSAVLPPVMLRRSLALRQTVLECGGREFALNKNLYLVGFGKAVLGMAAAAERIAGEHLVRGVISIPRGMEDSLKQAGRRDMLLSPGTRIRVMEGAANNMADEAAMVAAAEIRRLAQSLGEGHVLLVLISGGGSALLPAPVPPVTLQDKQQITQELALRGATIQELNTLRRALSQLKGGGLARAAYPAQVISLILSDVIGDDLDVIASGPTVSSCHSTDDCLHILSKYGLRDSISGAVERALRSKPPMGHPGHLSHVHNILIGSNSIALATAQQEAKRLGYLPLLLSTAISGDVTPVSRFYAALAQLLCASLTSCPQQQELENEVLALAATMAAPDLNLAAHLQELKRAGDVEAVCVLFGGETTVQVQGRGKGGRNQELALRVAAEWNNSTASSTMDGCEVVFLSGGTDGQDGPTRAAGAYAHPRLVVQALESGLDAERSLKHSDSNGFYSRFQDGKYLLVTGLTGTNVMDVQMLLVRRHRP